MSVWKCKDRDGYKWEFTKNHKLYVGYALTKAQATEAEVAKKQALRQPPEQHLPLPEANHLLNRWQRQVICCQSCGKPVVIITENGVITDGR